MVPAGPRRVVAERPVTSAAEYRSAVGVCVERTLAVAGHACGPGMLEKARFVPSENDYDPAIVGCGVCGAAFDALPLDLPPSDPVEPVAGQVATQAAVDPIGTLLKLIDPTEVYTPQQVEERMLDCVRRLEQGAMFERACILAAYAAKHAYIMASSRALVDVRGQGSEKDREAAAMVSCEELYEEMGRTKMMEIATKAAMHNLRSILSGYQSVLRSVGATYNAGGSAQGSPKPGGGPW